MCLTSSLKLIYLLFGIIVSHSLADDKRPRLNFTKEPPNLVEFVNTKGATIECAATGQPLPNVSWTLIDGTAVNGIPELREVTSSGNLIFHSFQPERFRPDVHTSVYRCVASNGVGVIYSRNVGVRGVVLQKFDIQVYDVYAVKGNTAIFKCHIPAVWEEYVTVTSWIKNDNLLIQPTVDSASHDKYALMPSGELHFREVSMEENGSRYKCKVTHRLTDDMVVSSSNGRIYVREPQGSLAPRITHSNSAVIVPAGQEIIIPCSSQGYPIPLTRWYKKTASGQAVPITNDNRFASTKSSLVIKESHISDAGTYVCEISNEMGREAVDISVTVTDSLSAVIQPAVQEVKIGSKTVLKCTITGHPTASFIWLHNGKSIKSASDELLTISSVQLADQGLYQCVAKNEFETVQAVAELQLTEVPPKFVETFKEVIVQPQSSVNLECSAEGNPTPMMSWNLDGNAINNNSRIKITSEVVKEGQITSRLLISKIVVEDGGLYSCIAANAGGKSRHLARVNVYGPLGIHVIPELQLVSGSSEILNCPLYGFPIPEILWEKDGRQMPIDLNHILLKNGSLYLRNIDARINTGKYKCIADTIEAGVKVKVIVSPKIIPFDFLDDQFYKGMRAHVTCAISQGDLPVHFEWLKDGLAIPPQLGVINRQYDDHTQSLSIDNVSSHHSGNYTCIARNKAGTAEHTAQLLVRVVPKIVPFHFGDLHSEGTPARVVCGLQEGDTPIQFSWLHNGLPIKTGNSISVHEVDGLSSILSFASLSAIHAGTYTCVAENGAGVAHHNATLHINGKCKVISFPVPVAPKIVPFSFQGDHVFEGALARLTCVVYQGDLPLTIRWQRDGNPIPFNLGISIHKVDIYTSILTIDHVEAKHGGNYTCIAQNQAASASHTAVLVVNVPPRWIIQPTDKAVLKDTNVMLHCQADGFPKPSISWMFIKDVKKDANPQELKDNQRFVTHPNGSLLIKNIDAKNEGYYFCNANNGIGIGIDTKVQIKIQAPPHFKVFQKMFEVLAGEEVQMKCMIYGDTPIIASWYKNDSLVLESNMRYKIETSTNISEVTTLLRIKDVNREDHGNFQCVAENNFGKNKTAFSLIVKGKPEPPISLDVTSLGSQFVELGWKMGYNGNIPIKKYIIQYKEAHESWNDAISMETVNGEPTNSIVANLRPATHYLFRLFAENDLGRSAPTQVLRVTTNEDVPSGQPINVQVESVNTETFKVTWKPLDEKTWNGRIQGFYIGYKEVDTEDPFLYKTLLTPNPKTEELSVQIGGLNKFTKYAVVVQAYNSQGKGPQSDPVVVMTSEGIPSLPPVDVRCTPLTSESIHVTWSAPHSDSINGILRGYKVLYKPASDWLDDLAESYNVTLPTSLTLNHLEKFRNYSIEVLAMTKAGDGPRSNMVFCKTMDDAPGPPVAIKAIATSDDSVIIAWKPPDHPNGVIKSYSVYWKTSVGNSKETGSRTVSERDQSYEVTGLKKGRRYEFWVAASTTAGEGAPSRVVSQSPSGPTVPAKVVSFDDKVIIPWKSNIDLACVSVGIPEPTRKWTLRDRIIESSSNTKISSDGTLAVKNIQEEDAGDYSCQVQNEFGTDKIVYTIIVLAPPSAPVVTVTKISSYSIELQWKTPSSKMSRIKGYNLHVKKDAGDWKEITIGADIRSHQLSNLDCGTRYEIYMSAFNKIGIGAPSEVLVISTNGTVPSPPGKPDLIEETSTSVSLYLNTWKSNGCPILYYVVEYSQKSSHEWIFVSNSIKPEHRRLVIPNLIPGTWYGLRMTAHNSAGSSIANYDFSTLTVSGATIPPDLLSDSAHDHTDGLWAYLNFYIIVPVCCTVVILLAILGVACYYVRSKNSSGQRMSANPELKRGDSSESFSYMQRGTMSKSSGSSKHVPSDITPYATLQLTGQRPQAPRQCPDVAPPLPPPRIEAFSGSGLPSRNPHFHGDSSNFIPHGSAETTFIFPNPPNDGRMHHHYPAQMYPQEVFKQF